ncbi:MAG: DEAD/DEAH box helicase family protein [Bacteroidales bacterium]|nr:DEAD/DEAH box helicase family protein [Bacteroidales bacterium]
MEIKLEELEYQQIAIKSVVKVFDKNNKNTFDNACFEGIRSNICSLSKEQLAENIKSVIVENGIDEVTAKLSELQELTIEMETGTGKTLVYIKTIYQLFKDYGFTKFIILVPSVAIRQGVLSAISTFETQLEDIYKFTPKHFEYNSKKLNKVTNFIEEQHPQIMVMTLASFNSEEKILNQAKREDLFANIPFIEAIGRTNPIIIMDEPQEGMDTENSVNQIAKLNPLFKLRYSATHKVSVNKVYRLTPYDSYKEGLVKRIEVLTVTEKNDEATLKLELSEIKNEKNPIQAKIKAWHQLASGKIEFKDTKWLKDGDNLGEVTNNPSYLKYKIERINKSLRTGKWSVSFTNGTEILEKQTSGNIQSVWALQLEWLILRHLAKNPPQYIHQASSLIKNIELEEMLRGLDYHLTDETFPFEFNDFVKQVENSGYTETPKRGIWDKMLVDSHVEHQFALATDLDDEVVCFLKLPSYYKIQTPIGEYEPDFGIVMKRKSLRNEKESEFYFVIETKGTNDINNKKALKESEVYKIQCALKHFAALGVDVQYKAPVKDYQYFKTEATKSINETVEQ